MSIADYLFWKSTQPQAAARFLYGGLAILDTFQILVGQTHDIINIVGTGEVNGLFVDIQAVGGSASDTGTYMEIVLDNHSTGLITMAFWHSLVNDTVNTSTDIVFTQIDETIGAERHRMNFRKPFIFKDMMQFKVRYAAGSATHVLIRMFYWKNMLARVL